MNRRRFVVTSASALAVGGLIAADACSSTAGFSPGSMMGLPSPAPLVHDLVCGYKRTVFNTSFGRFVVNTRTYNGATHGPQIEVRPGETLSMRVRNELPAVVEPTPPPHANAMDNPHGFNVTNLHVHGIQTVPHLFDPIGTSDPMAPMIMIEPGKSMLYNFPIPPDHPSGLFWYHPHKHGSTDVEVGGGMAGLLVVRGEIDEVPEIAAAREIFMVVQTLTFNKQDATGTYVREYTAYQAQQSTACPTCNGYTFTNYYMFMVNGRPVYWLDVAPKIGSSRRSTRKGRLIPVPSMGDMPSATHGMGSLQKVGTGPSYTLQPGEVVRLRMLNGTNCSPLFLALEDWQASGGEVWLIGFDGINTLAPIPLDLSGVLVGTRTKISKGSLLAMSANRVEMLLRAPNKAGSYTLTSAAITKGGIGGHVAGASPQLDLAEFVVSGNPVAMKVPKQLPVPTREYPIVTRAECVQQREFVFDCAVPSPQNNVRPLLNNFAFYIRVNGVDRLYDETETSTRPRVGTCEEWTLANPSAFAHSFHLHVNSFQVIAVNDEPLDPVLICDTYVIPGKSTVRIRIRFKEWYGKTVFHCHVLPHEDMGMMANILLS